MKALVYKSLGEVELQERPRPELVKPTDAIIKVTKTTICGSDLHIRQGHVSTCMPGRVLGHEGVGIVEEAGSSVTKHKKGDHVLILCMTSCSSCEYCRRAMYSHCSSGGWLLGNTIDGCQAEYVRVPHADSSLLSVPEHVDEGGLVMLSDAFPTGYEVGTLAGKVAPGGTVVIIGVGPIGMASLITAQWLSPSILIAVDNDENRLRTAKEMGATHTATAANAVEVVKSATGSRGCDTVMEAVGIPATFALAQRLLAVGGTLANVGVHGTKVELFLDELWSHNITIKTSLVDTASAPMLLGLVQSGKLNATKLVTHRFKFDDMEKAYQTFGSAAKHDCLKVLIEME
ncbi:hypothetical protein N0V82_008503 [Gnomoniopsis sp. IMI 355080]|nr:hypothetical protein N0V82_008503 [Gnomoniopsis sp. IMI 355080]